MRSSEGSTPSRVQITHRVYFLLLPFFSFGCCSWYWYCWCHCCCCCCSCCSCCCCCYNCRSLLRLSRKNKEQGELTFTVGGFWNASERVANWRTSAVSRTVWRVPKCRCLKLLLYQLLLLLLLLPPSSLSSSSSSSSSSNEPSRLLHPKDSSSNTRNVTRTDGKRQFDSVESPEKKEGKSKVESVARILTRLLTHWLPTAVQTQNTAEIEFIKNMIQFRLNF